MLQDTSRRTSLRLLAALLLLVLPLALIGCEPKGEAAGSANKDEPAAEAPASEEPEEPEYSSWVVYVNDDDSYSAGGITYSIALNLKATNPTGDPAGKYTGSATAKTDTNGSVGGAQLSASAIAKSSTLTFTLEDPTADGQLAQLTDDEQLLLSGSGSIVMKAAGSGTIGGAGGSFSNTSGQNLKVSVNGDKVTLSVVISGHKYTFDGTISGK